MTSFVFSQILIGIAFCFDLAAFQFKSRKHILLCMIVSAALIATHFIALDRITAGLFIYVGVVRYALSYFTTSTKVMFLCMILTTSVLFLTFTGMISIIAYMGAMVGTWSSFRPDDRTLRRGAMVGTSLWIIHNILVKSPAAVVLEVFFLAGNFLGYYRFYLKRSVERVV